MTIRPPSHAGRKAANDGPAGPSTNPLAHAEATATVAIATTVSWVLRNELAPADIAMLHTLGVVIVATRLSLGPALLAATLSVASYTFFFIPPVFGFKIEDARHLLTCAVMFGVGVVISTLTERVRRLGEEARAAALRAQTEEMRSSLLSAVSHDLRTPLAVITGAGTTLRDRSTSISDAERQDLVVTMCEEADRLERLVRNLLDMTRVESKSLAVKREWISVDDLVSSALTRMEKELRGRTTTLELPDDLPLLRVDPILFGQVLLNLLDNATKHTPEGTPIEIRARTRDGALDVDVADSGAGFSDDERERVFEKFYRGARAVKQGAGLGLAICRGIVEAHGGSLTALDDRRGGAVLRICLPLDPNAPPVPTESPTAAMEVRA